MSYGRGRGGDQDDDETFEEFRKGVDHAMWKILTTYGHRRRFEFVVGGLAGLISRAVELLPPILLAVAIDSLFTQDVAFADAVPVVPAAYLPTTLGEQFALLVGILALIYVLEAGLNWVNSWAWNHFAQHLQHEVRIDTYDAMQAMEMEFFDNKQTGEVMSILNNDVNQLENFLTGNLNTFIRIFVMVGGTGAVMLLYNWQLALVAMAPIPILGVTSYVFVRIIKPKYYRVRAMVGTLNSRLENNLGGIEVVKSYTTEQFESDRVESASRDYLDANWSAILTRIKFWPTLQLITGFGYLVTFLIGGYWVIFGEFGPFTGTLTAGILVMFLMYTQRFMWPMRQFGEILNNYQYAEAAAQRIFGLINQPVTVQEAEDATELERVIGRVEYDDVSFTYKTEGVADRETVLKDVSFVAEPGEYVGLVGPTGAGKTTLMKLLLRLYDIDDGSITVDRNDVRDVTIESLRESIGYVSQDPFLFYGTVRDNIAYGMTAVDDAAVIDAAKRAGAYEFIRELPEGLDTMVGERGVKLSGGQRQRVSLARAILKDPEILILDEATSHVDNETEVLIQNSLRDLIADRTTFAIAHRLSTVRKADQILVLDDGEIVEQGTHDRLLEHDGLYANLWRVQVGEMEALPQEFIERTALRQARLDDDD